MLTAFGSPQLLPSSFTPLGWRDSTVGLEGGSKRQDVFSYEGNSRVPVPDEKSNLTEAYATEC